MDYHLLREFADSWMLLGMFAFFVGVVIWVFRPGSSRSYDDSAEIPFRHESAPAPDEPRDAAKKDARS